IFCCNEDVVVAVGGGGEASGQVDAPRRTQLSRLNRVQQAILFHVLLFAELAGRACTAEIVYTFVHSRKIETVCNFTESLFSFQMPPWKGVTVVVLQYVLYMG